MKQLRNGTTRRWDVPHGLRVAPWQQLSPPQLFVGSFALLVLLGAMGLRFLPGLYTAQGLTWLDALFTSTSAVCVTGLIVVDTAKHFTLLGQAFVLLLIQLGGLGMLTFASLIIVALGKRLSLRAEASSIVSSDSAPHIDRRRMTLDIVRFTFLFEGIGAILLFCVWAPRIGMREALWPAIFHAVSAFCNAGFSTWTDSLIGYQQSPGTLIIIMGLILAGGLGFLTHEELFLFVQSKIHRRAFRFSLQSRLVLITTIFLTVATAPLFAIFEWDNTLKDLPTVHRVVNAVFLTVTPRTAGFNAIDYGAATDSSNLLTILLMTIGGSPGSTAGGIKTTTVALIGLLAWSRLRGLESTDCFGRSIPEETTSRAVGLFAIASGIAVAGVFVLTTTETGAKSDLIQLMFEAASAFNTVGLSMGITPDLSVAGRWVAILLMFFGRVGLLTLAAALTLHRSQITGFRYAYEDVVVG